MISCTYNDKISAENLKIINCKENYMNKKLRIILIVTVLVVLIGIIICFIHKKSVDYVVIKAK